MGRKPVEVQLLSPALPIEVRPAARAMTTSIGSFLGTGVGGPQSRMSTAAATRGTSHAPRLASVRSRDAKRLLEEDAECRVVRAAAGEQIRCDVMVDAALGQNEGGDRIEAGVLECVEAPVEHTLMLAPAEPQNDLLLHPLFFGSEETPLNGRRQQGLTRTRDAPTSPE